MPGGPEARRHGPPPPRRPSPRHPLLLVACQGLAEGRAPPPPLVPPEHLTPQHMEGYPGTGCPTTPPSIVIRPGGIGLGGGEGASPDPTGPACGLFIRQRPHLPGVDPERPCHGPPSQCGPRASRPPSQVPPPLSSACLPIPERFCFFIVCVRFFFGVRWYGT